MLVRVAVVVGVLVLSSAVGLAWQRRSGRFRATTPPSTEILAAPAPGSPLTALPLPATLGAAALGVDLGSRATLVQFSSAFCAPCRATRIVLTDLAGVVPGVRHVEIDAEAHLDLVRELKVLSTPTVFVLDAAGAIVSRATGLPNRQQVLAALVAAIPPSSSTAAPTPP